MSSNHIRVILVDDHQVLLEGLQYLLRDATDLKVVAEANNGQELLDYLAHSSEAVDLVLMDIEMPVMDGITATRKVKKRYPQLKVIMLTMVNNYAALNQARDSGADGFISKNHGQKAIIEAIRQVYYDGEFVIQANLNQSSNNPTFSSSTSPPSRPLQLTLRERRILVSLHHQMGIPEIAKRLTLSTHALTTQLRVLFAKLQVKTADEAIAQVLELGLMSANDFATTPR